MWRLSSLTGLYAGRLDQLEPASEQTTLYGRPRVRSSVPKTQRGKRGRVDRRHLRGTTKLERRGEHCGDIRGVLPNAASLGRGQPSRVEYHIAQSRSEERRVGKECRSR